MNPIAFLFAMLALVGTVVGGVVVGRSMQASSTRMATASLLTQVASNIRAHYLTQGSFSGITTSTELLNGDVPGSAVLGDHAVTPYGGGLEIAGSGSVEGGVDNAFGISLTNLPQDLCIGLATEVAAYGVNSGSTVGDGSNTANAVASEAASEALCAAASNTLTWTFTLD